MTDAATTEKPDLRKASYLTVPQFHRLNWACAPLREAFGEYPYLVGSVLRRPDYRDVDLRLSMSPDNDSFGTDFWIEGTRRLVINCAISDWLRQITQLPLDFQLQPYEEFKTYKGQGRNPMGMPR